MAARLDAAGPTQGSIQGGEGEDGRAVLTMGQWCSHGRLNVVVHVNDVDVPGGGAPPAPVPWTRTVPSTAQRLPLGDSRSGQPPVSLAWRGGGASSFFPPLLPPSPLSAVE
jgi:hypothetical protein